MLNEFDGIAKIDSKEKEQNVYLSKYTTMAEGGRRDLFEAQFYRETCLIEEKQNSTLLNVTLDKLIKAMAPLK